MAIVRRSRLRPWVLCPILLLVIGVAPARGQFDSASVVGTVRDAFVAVVPVARVTLTGVETGISVSKASGSDGNYEVAAV